MRKWLALAAFAAAAGIAPARAEMLDDAWFGAVRVDQLEYRAGEDSNLAAWDVEASYGSDEWKLVLESEAEYAVRQDAFETLENRFLVRRAVTDFFDARAGLRVDSPAGPDRVYGLIGLQGLAQQWFEIEADLFLSEKGDPSARIGADYDLLITNRLILQPAAELDLAGSDDDGIGQGQGFTRVELGLRLRYELLDRTVAPYLGVHWEKTLGETALRRRAEGEDGDAVRLVAGVRLLF